MHLRFRDDLTKNVLWIIKLALLPIELCTSYVPKFRILRAHGLLTRSENWLLFSMVQTNSRKKYNHSYPAKKLPLQI